MRISVRGLFGLAVMVLIAGGVLMRGQHFGIRQATAEDFRGLTPAEAKLLQRRVEHSIIEQGTVESASVLELHSRLRGEAVVISATADGSVVKRGDLLAVFDDAALRQEQLEQQVAVKQAEAVVAAAKAAVESVKRRAAAEIPTAELALRVAELAHDRYLHKDGELTTRLAAAERAIAVARERLKVAEHQAKAAGEKSTAAANDAISRFAVAEARAKLESALGEKHLLVNHIRPHESAALELGVLQARSELQQTRDSAAAGARTAEAELRTAEAKLTLAAHRLQEVEQQIGYCRISAPRDGTVMQVAPNVRRTGTAALEPGTVVRPGQLLFRMPDLDQLRVRVRVHESRIGRVKPGQDVSLRLDGFPQQTFGGKVTEISRTPEPSQWFTQDVVEYGVLVEIPAPPPGLKLGMTAAAEIFTAEKAEDESN